MQCLSSNLKSLFGHSYSYVIQWSNQSGKISDQGWSGSDDPDITIWVMWVTFMMGHAGLICKLNYLDVTQIFNRSHIFRKCIGIWYLGLVMHWTIIGMKQAYYHKLFGIMWCPEISFSRIPCIGPDLYAGKKEEIYGIVSYLTFHVILHYF